MTVPRWIRFIGYPSWFFACLVFFLYLTFPMNSVRGMVIDKMEEGLGRGKQGRFGSDPVVTIGKLDTHRASGLHFENLSLQLGSKNADPGATIDFDEVNVRFPITSLLFGSPVAEFDGKIYSGTFDASVEIADTKAADEKLFGELRALADGRLDPVSHLRTVELQVDGVNLGRAPAVIAAVGLPVAGTIDAKVDLKLGDDASKDGAGSLMLKGTGLAVGEGKLPIAGGFSVPYVDLGTLDAKIEIKEGKGESKTFKLTGRDVSAELTPSLRLRKNVMTSNLTGPGWFKLSDSFLKENGKFKAILFDFPGPQKKAKDKDDKFHFSLRGSLKSPGATLSKNAGKSPSKSRARSRSRRKK